MFWELKYENEIYHASQKAAEQAMKEGLEEGREQGLEQGRKQQLDELSRLSTELQTRGRFGELARAIEDADYRAQLLEEFGIGK